MRMRMVLPYPPSTNVYWRYQKGRVVKSTRARQYNEEVGWISKTYDTILHSGPVAIYLWVYRPQRSGDLDNRIKPLLDTLQGICYEDDKQIEEIHAYRRDDKDSPRVEIEVVPCE